MEKVKKIIKTIMVETYINEGKILGIQEVQNILISMGFSYYRDKNGVKKLRILKSIRNYYYKIKYSLEKYKKERDFAYSVLESAVHEYLQGNISLRTVIDLKKQLKPKLTRTDIEKINTQLRSKKGQFKVKL